MTALPDSTRTSLRGRLPLGAATLALAMALSACGGEAGDEETATGAATSAPTSSAAEPTSPAATPSSEAPADEAEAQTVTATEGEMYIELSTEEFSAGSYTFEVVNEGSATHDFVVERNGEDVTATDTIAPGESTTLTVDLEPGEYVFYCSVGNHRAQGMEVTVTVA